MGRLTDVQIRNWLKAGKPVAKSDGDGLTFTLSANGTASWVLRYRVPGVKSQKELTLGRRKDVSLAEARSLAAAARGKVQQGTDVGREKQKNKREAARRRARVGRQRPRNHQCVPTTLVIQSRPHPCRLLLQGVEVDLGHPNRRRWSGHSDRKAALIGSAKSYEWRGCGCGGDCAHLAFRLDGLPILITLDVAKDDFGDRALLKHGPVSPPIPIA